MKCGLLAPTSGEYGNPKVLQELAIEAEKANWDGFFIWDQIIGDNIDSFTTLSAISVVTNKIKIGPMITPIARRRPWKLARETVNVDILSNGRLIFGAALGGPPEAFSTFGEDDDNIVRGQKLDEGLEILTGLWTGEEFTFFGDHYKVGDKELGGHIFKPGPIQSPRIPIWIGGLWPNKGPFRRAARWDGVIPHSVSGEQLRVDQVKEISNYIKKYRTSSEPFELVMLSSTPTDKKKSRKIIEPYERIGVTWWIESTHEWEKYNYTFEDVKNRIKQGPP